MIWCGIQDNVEPTLGGILSLHTASRAIRGAGYACLWPGKRIRGWWWERLQVHERGLLG